MDAMGDFPGALHHFANDDEDSGREPANEYIIPIDPNDPDSADRLARAYAEEARLQRALRSAGLL